MDLLQRLGLDLPIVQAPMAGVSTPELAAAVSNAGGLGSLGLGNLDAVRGRAAIRETRARTDRVFNVNLFVHQAPQADATREAAWLEQLAPLFALYGATPPTTLRPSYTSLMDNPAMLSMLVEEKPPVVSFHFGLPQPAAIAALRDQGCFLMATATSLDEARSVAGAGLDAVVAQGIEAGGHRGVFDPAATDDALGTIALTRLLVREIRLPVIAAGGLMDGAGITAVLRLGAAAAQLGTAFVACPESAADPAYRAALHGSGAFHTRMTDTISGRPARVLANRFASLAETLAGRLPPAYPIAYDAAKALHAAASAKGDHGYGVHWAGQGAPLVRAMPAAKLMEVLRTEMAVTDGPFS